MKTWLEIMTQLLISVTSVKEAQIALQCGADFIDLKDPKQGALGALPLEVVTDIVTFIGGKDLPEKKVISATVGDLAMEPALLQQQVLTLSKTKVDIVKIGFFGELNAGAINYQPCLDALRPIAESGVMLIAVLFVEYEYAEDLVSAIKGAGFYGVMLDTAEKNGTTFLNYFSVDEIKSVAKSVQSQGLLFGLAGSLNLQHIGVIKEIAPDYMGFRGGVCANNNRKSELDPDKIRAIRKVI